MTGPADDGPADGESTGEEPGQATAAASEETTRPAPLRWPSPQGTDDTGGDDLVERGAPAPLDADAVVRLLRSVGVTPQDINDARAHRHLELLAIEHLVMPESAGHDIDEVAEATGLSRAEIAQLWRSLGFVEPRPGDRIFTDVDVDMLRTIGHLLEMGLIDDELTVQMARVIGSSLSRIASALIDAVDPAEPVEYRAHPSSRGGDDFASALPVMLPTLAQIMDFVWRRHVQAEARGRMAREHAGSDPDHRAVGFADLVGFTALSQQVTAHELAAVVDRFEAIAYDTVLDVGGRVVKMIGDEVMFSVSDERSAAEIGLSLAEIYRDDDELSDVRVGLAAGPVLQREADLYGPVVNRASRIVNIAFPGTVVCSDEIQDVLAEDPAFLWKPIGSRNLKNIGKVPLFVLRRTEEPTRDRSSIEEAEARRAERRETRVTEIADRRRSPQRRRNRSDQEPGDQEPGD